MLGLIILGLIILFIIMICYEGKMNSLSEEHSKELHDKEVMWQKKTDSVRAYWDEETKREKARSKELEEKLQKEFEINNNLKENIISLQSELQETKEKRQKAIELKKLLPRRPVTRNREEIVQYVKDYLTVCGIDYKDKHTSNGLLSVYGDTYLIYCGTELFYNRKKMDKKHGLKNMVKEIQKLKKGEKSNEE